MPAEPQGPRILSLHPLQEVSESVPESVRMRLCELFPLLMDALQNDRRWLDDFADEEIAVSEDLHDVVQAYSHFHRKSA